MNRESSLFQTIPAVLALVTLLAASTMLLSPAASQSPPNQVEVMPAYDEEGRFLLPTDWRTWVFVGSSLGLSYSEGSGGTEMFHETLLEPSAYDHFVRTGEFRDGTMLALLLHNTGDSVLPQRRGRFAGELGGLELAVKDSSREDTWSYYGFGGRSGLRESATAMGSESCNSCHVEHAAHDNVFMQFYPLLAQVAPAGAVFASNGGGQAEAVAAAATPTGPPVALDGLDPVLLSDGHAELGKPEIVMTHEGFEYQFVSEPTRVRFEADPERYSFQNESCPVISGAPLNPSLFAVHESRIYGFASQNCVDQFNAEPERYLPSGAESSA